jgi:hypothetical protein
MTCYLRFNRIQQDEDYLVVSCNDIYFDQFSALIKWETDFSAQGQQGVDGRDNPPDLIRGRP